MAAYAYKDVVYRIPDQFTKAIEDYEGDPSYDGDAWTATSDWIDALLAEIAALKLAVAAARAEGAREALARVPEVVREAVWILAHRSGQIRWEPDAVLVGMLRAWLATLPPLAEPTPESPR